MFSECYFFDHPSILPPPGSLEGLEPPALTGREAGYPPKLEPPVYCRDNTERTIHMETPQSFVFYNYKDINLFINFKRD